MKNMAHHWTSRSVEDFAYRIASDFANQIETKLELSGTGRNQFAKAVGVTPGRVSQVLNNPSLFNLKSMVSYATGAGMKVAVVAYEDGDPSNLKGPINAQVFTECWQDAGSPRDLFEIPDVRSQHVMIHSVVGQSYYRGQIRATPIAQGRGMEQATIDCVIAGQQSPAYSRIIGQEEYAN